MTLPEFLLNQIAEECCEVAVRVSKAKRFGIDEVEPGQFLSNADRIHGEMIDLTASYTHAATMGLVPPITGSNIEKQAASQKIRKIEKHLNYSQRCGTLSDPDFTGFPERQAPDKLLLGIRDAEQYEAQPGHVITVVNETHGVGLMIPGYGTADTTPQQGGPVVLLEMRDGIPHLVVWADITSEDPTHIISLGKAHEKLREAE